MNITAIVSLMLVVQVSASFLDVFQGAVHSVQNSFGKLFSDVVADVKDTVDCTILAVEYVLSLNKDATARYKEKCGTDNGSTSNVETKKNNVPAVEISFLNNDHLNKALPEDIDARINETMIKIINGYNPHDKLAEVERELAKETERLANVSSLVKEELDKLSAELHFDFSNQQHRHYKPNVDIILRELKLLEAIEQSKKNSPEADEIHKVVENVLHKLNVIEASEITENFKVDKILKDLENNSNVTYKDLRKRLEHWKKDEDRQLDLIKKHIEEHDKVPEQSNYLQKIKLDNALRIEYKTLVPANLSAPIINLNTTESILADSSAIVPGQLQASSLDDVTQKTSSPMIYTMPSNLASTNIGTNKTKETVSKLITPESDATTFKYNSLKNLEHQNKNQDNYLYLIKKEIKENVTIPVQLDYLLKTKLDSVFEIQPNLYTKQSSSYGNSTIQNGTNVITPVNSTPVVLPPSTVINIAESPVTENLASRGKISESIAVNDTFNTTISTRNDTLVTVTMNIMKDTIIKSTTPALSETTFIYKDLQKRLGHRKKDKDRELELLKEQIEQDGKIPNTNTSKTETPIADSQSDSIYNNTNYITTMNNTPLIMTTQNAEYMDVVSTSNPAKNSINLTTSTLYRDLVPVVTNTLTVGLKSESILTEPSAAIPGILRGGFSDDNNLLSGPIYHNKLTDVLPIDNAANVTKEVLIKFITPVLSESSSTSFESNAIQNDSGDKVKVQGIPTTRTSTERDVLVPIDNKEEFAIIGRVVYQQLNNSTVQANDVTRMVTTTASYVNETSPATEFDIVTADSAITTAANIHQTSLATVINTESEYSATATDLNLIKTSPLVTVKTDASDSAITTGSYVLQTSPATVVNTATANSATATDLYLNKISPITDNMETSHPAIITASYVDQTSPATVTNATIADSAITTNTYLNNTLPTATNVEIANSAKTIDLYLNETSSTAANMVTVDSVTTTAANIHQTSLATVVYTDSATATDLSLNKSSPTTNQMVNSHSAITTASYVHPTSPATVVNVTTTNSVITTDTYLNKTLSTAPNVETADSAKTTDLYLNKTSSTAVNMVTADSATTTALYVRQALLTTVVNTESSGIQDSATITDLYLNKTSPITINMDTYDAAITKTSYVYQTSPATVVNIETVDSAITTDKYLKKTSPITVNMVSVDSTTTTGSYLPQASSSTVINTESEYSGTNTDSYVNKNLPSLANVEAADFAKPTALNLNETSSSAVNMETADSAITTASYVYQSSQAMVDNTETANSTIATDTYLNKTLPITFNMETAEFAITSAPYVHQTSAATVVNTVTADSATTIIMNTNDIDSDNNKSYISLNNTSTTTTPISREQNVIVDSKYTTAIPSTTLNVLSINSTIEQRQGENNSGYSATSVKDKDGSQSINVESSTTEKSSHKPIMTTPSLNAFLKYIDRLIITTAMPTENIVENQEVSVNPVVSVTNNPIAPVNNKLVPPYYINAKYPKKTVPRLLGFAPPNILSNADPSVRTRNMAVSPLYTKHSMRPTSKLLPFPQSMTSLNRPLLPAKAYGTPLPYIKNYPALVDKPAQWNFKRPQTQPLSNGIGPADFFNRMPISSNRYKHPNKKTDNFDDPDYDSFFHLSSKDTKAHEDALKEARSLIKESQRANRVMHNILNKTGKGISPFNLQKSLKFG